LHVVSAQKRFRVATLERDVCRGLLFRRVGSLLIVAANARRSIGGRHPGAVTAPDIA
jgi:hypothetical protein